MRGRFYAVSVAVTLAAGAVACTSILGDFSIGVSSSEDGGGTGSEGGGSDGASCTMCGSACADLTNDSNNCGACGKSCGSGFTCAASRCDSAATMFAAGQNFTCAQVARGDVYCWGANAQGQLGQGTGADAAPSPTALVISKDNENNPVKSFVAFGTGAVHACALKSDGTSVCWGDGFFGQLSDNTVSFDGTDHFAAVPQAANQTLTPFGAPPPAFSYSAFGIGPESDHQCAITVDAGLACWGLDDTGQLGYTDAGSGLVQQNCWNPNDMAADVTCGVRPYMPPGFPSVKQVADGRQYSCLVDTDGGVVCFGSGAVTGERGNGTTHLCFGPTCLGSNYVSLPARAAQVTTGGGFTCAALVDGTVYCWGLDGYGQLGHDPKDAGASGLDSGVDDCCSVEPGCSSSTPCMAFAVVVPGLDNVKEVHAGGTHACALRNDGSVWCWGANDLGQLGIGATDTSGTPRPTPPTPVSNMTDAVALTVGDSHSCVIRKDGTVWCWGANDRGQLGNGAVNSNVPVEVQGLPLQ